MANLPKYSKLARKRGFWAAEGLRRAARGISVEPGRYLELGAAGNSELRGGSQHEVRGACLRGRCLGGFPLVCVCVRAVGLAVWRAGAIIRSSAADAARGSEAAYKIADAMLRARGGSA